MDTHSLSLALSLTLSHTLSLSHPLSLSLHSLFCVADEFMSTLATAGQTLTSVQASSLMKLSFTIKIHQADLLKVCEVHYEHLDLTAMCVVLLLPRCG
jgi:hypothetical protein